MPGFFTIIDKTKSNKRQFEENAFYKSLEVETLKFAVNSYSDSIKKFENDKLFYNDEYHIIILEGVIFNKKELIEKYKKDNWLESVREMYTSNNNSFYMEFRGSYSGYVYNKLKDTWTIYTNPIGDKQVFYFQNTDVILFGSEIKHFLTFFQQNEIKYTLDEASAYMLLSYGYFIGNHTLFSEIRKLNAGHYISIKDNNFEVIQYHQFRNEPNFSLKESEIFDGIDYYFRQAIKRQFEKDKEYNYRSLVALSGGLDSRMTTWVAHDMGYTDMLNYTFSQSGYLDQSIAQEIAGDLNHELIFKSLDGGVFLKRQLEEVVKLNYGGSLYYSLAHGKSALDLIDFSNLGLIHTGLIGGELLSGQGEDLQSTSYYSAALLNKIKCSLNTLTIQNDSFYIYNRLFNFSLQGVLPSFQKTESFSPFYDFDFLSFILKVPVEYKKNYKIYHKWILNKYPKAGDYVWEKTKQKLTDKNINVKLKGRSIPIKNIPRLALRKFGLIKYALNTKHHMNPLEYWYNTNSDIATFQDEYFENTIDLVENEVLRKDCEKLYTEGTAIEKNQVLTLLSALRLFF